MNRLPSKYTEKLVSEQARLAEIIIEHQNLNVKLPKNFWQLDKYKRSFQVQLRLSLALLKLYPFEAILAALNTKQGSKVFSINAKWLDPIIREEWEKIKVRERVKEMNKEHEFPPIINIPFKTEPKPENNTESLFTKLDS